MNSVLWGRVKSFIKEDVQPIIANLVEEQGHKVVWYPPHHSDLQPIQLVWDNVKGAVGIQYTTDKTFKDKKTRLIAAFSNYNQRRSEFVFESPTIIIKDFQSKFWRWRILWRTFMATMMMISTKTAALRQNFCSRDLLVFLI